MGAKKNIDKNCIIEGSMALLRRRGSDFLNARLIAKELGCSTQPIYDAFQSMSELKSILLSESKKVLGCFFTRFMGSSNSFYMDYMKAYVAFAREEPKLYEYIYLKNGYENTEEDRAFVRQVVEIIRLKGGYSEKDAIDFYYAVWFFAHGLASQIVTGFAEYSDESVNELLQTHFEALKMYYQSKRD